MQQLSPEEIALSKSLPKKYEKVTLTGRRIRLEPYDSGRDSQTLFERTNGSPISLGSKSVEAYDPDELVWRFMFFGPFESVEQFQSAINPYTELPNHTFFTIFDIESNSQIGFLSMMNNFPEFLKVEIGCISISPIAQRSGVCLEANYLLLEHAFNLGYRRLEWKCNNLNERSKSTAVSIGYSFEGVQMYHMIIKGKNRDTAWFRILKREWPEVRERILEKLNRY